MPPSDNSPAVTSRGTEEGKTLLNNTANTDDIETKLDRALSELELVRNDLALVKASWLAAGKLFDRWQAGEDIRDVKGRQNRREEGEEVSNSFTRLTTRYDAQIRDGIQSGPCDTPSA